MPQVIQPREGYASVEYKLILGDKKTINFDPARVTFENAEIKEDVYSHAQCLHTFTTIDPQFLDAVKVAMSSANPLLEFRIGFGTPTDNYWLPWQRHIITKYIARYEGIGTAAGHMLVFQTADALVRYERSNKVAAHKGTITEIVKAVADANAIPSVIEPTDGKFLLYQSFQDDTRFVRHRCLPRAINRHGRGGFYFFIRDNVLHFHTPDYQTNVWQMNYYDVFGTELSVTDLSQDPLLWDRGVAGARVIAHDPYTGQTQEVLSQPDKAMRLSDYIYQFSDVNNAEWNIPFHLSINPPVEVTAMAQCLYQRTRQQVFQTGIKLDKTIVIRHGDFLNLSIAQQNNQASSHSGYYLVTSVFHMVKKQSVTTSYTLERGEFRGSTQSLSAQNARDQLLPESKAPGEFPNILEVQSSELTKGAGKQSSAKTYTVVADANTGKTV